MPDHLFVLVGAGASFDSDSRLTRGHADRSGMNAELRPPLVTELFESRSTFMTIMEQYPLALQAAPDIRLESGPEGIEEFLRERLRDSSDQYARLRYQAIPLYLQHLMFEISRDYALTGHGFTRLPDNYARLVTATLPAEEITFITLNYDTLLDKQLFANDLLGLTDMDSYVRPDRNWSLVKLHGSWNWGRAVQSPQPEIQVDDHYLARTFQALGEPLTLDPEIVLRLGDDLRDVRQEEGPDVDQAPLGSIFYPALSAPLGSEDEFSCPEQHVEYLRERLAAHESLNLLVIGYSGLDQEVLRLLRENGKPVRAIYVVSGSEDDAVAARARIMESMEMVSRRSMWTATESGRGFTHLAQTDELREFLRSLD